MARNSKYVALPETVVVTLVSMVRDRVYVEDMELYRAREYFRDYGKIRYRIYQLGYTSMESNVGSREELVGFSVPPAPKGFVVPPPPK